MQIEIPVSHFDQGKILIESNKNFKNDIEDILGNTRVWGNIKKNLNTFAELLKYVVGDVLVDDNQFKKAFMLELENCEQYCKTLTKQHRKLKQNIVAVLEDRMLICDNRTCMEFFSSLIQANLTILVDNKKQASMFDAGFSKNLHISISDDGYDYGFKPTMHCDKKFGVYLSKALAESLSVADLRKAFSEHASISSKHLKKQDIIDRLE